MKNYGQEVPDCSYLHYDYDAFDGNNCTGW